ncbi:MAG: hypothetical protein M1831_007157 [Alyxoria varia]|nr:MAG: hypothetical protein M1831_007157 [Alyxoria varia]
MSSETFNLPDSDPPVSVSIPSTPTEHTQSLTSNELLQFPAFRTWLNTIRRSLALQQTQSSHPFHSDPYKLRSIKVQSIDRFGGQNGKLGFVKLSAQVCTDAGYAGDKAGALPGSIFLRGGTVGMLVILRPQEGSGTANDEEAYAVLTVQPRVPAGTLAMPELPAGMLDDAGTFAGAAAKEMEEELDIKIKEDELFDMTDYALNSQSKEDSDPDTILLPAVYTSPGGQDEHMALFLYQTEVPRDKLFKDWAGKLTGVREHGEKITLKLCKLQNLWREAGRDAKVLSAWALYENLKREGVVSSGRVDVSKGQYKGTL